MQLVYVLIVTYINMKTLREVFLTNIKLYLFTTL